MDHSNQSYIPSLSKLSTQITWLTFAILIIIGTNSFLLYRFHFGALTAYKARADFEGSHEDLLIQERQGNVPKDQDPKTTVENRLKDQGRFAELQKQSSMITLPLLGIPLLERDFFILLLIVGVVFLLWLFTLLKYTKSFLENLLNEYHYPSDDDANTIQSLFFLIMPGDYTATRVAYFEWIFILFVGSIGLLVTSDAYDIFFRINPSSGLQMFREQSFPTMKPHLWVFYGIVLIGVFVSLILYKHARSTLKHIRNALILLRWNRTAFFPALYEFAENRNKPLGEKRNFIEYRACDDSGDSKLVLLLNLRDGTSHEFKGSVDLPKSMRRCYKLHKTSKTEFDEKLDRPLTIEESFMRSYFRRILTDKSYEPELFNEVAKLT